jgi:hypothetical protein
MTATLDVPALYSTGINLWVEDSLSRDYLAEVLFSLPIKFLVAGGRDGVSALCKQASLNRFLGVFGIVDRDFGSTNYADWQNPSKGFNRFVLPVREIENLMLEPAAFADCKLNSGNKNEQSILDQMHECAKNMVWSMACGEVLQAIRHSLLDDFPSHPGPGTIGSVSEAVTHIVDSPWFKRVASTGTPIPNAKELEASLVQRHANYDSMLQSDSWRNGFAGKAIFRHAVSFICSGPAVTDTRYSDVAKEIAQWQLRTTRLPKEIVDLASAIRARAGLP